MLGVRTADLEPDSNPDGRTDSRCARGHFVLDPGAGRAGQNGTLPGSDIIYRVVFMEARLHGVKTVVNCKSLGYTQILGVPRA